MFVTVAIYSGASPNGDEDGKVGGYVSIAGRKCFEACTSGTACMTVDGDELVAVVYRS